MYGGFFVNNGTLELEEGGGGSKGKGGGGGSSKAGGAESESDGESDGGAVGEGWVRRRVCYEWVGFVVSALAP